MQQLQRARLISGIDYLRFCPHPQQLKFLRATGVFSQVAALCGTAAGKTKVGLAADVSRALKYPGSVGFIFEPSYPMIRRILFPALESRDFFGCRFPYTQNPLVADFSRQDMCLEFVNGSQWWFVSLDDPERAEGPNADYGHIDEARLIRQLGEAWRTVVRRMRGSGRCCVPHSPAVWITTTTDQPGSDLYNITENPETASPEMKVCRWSIYDNLTLSKKYIAEMLRLHTGGNRARFIYGLFAAVAAGTLPFDYAQHVKELPSLPDLGMISTMRYGVDVGWSAPSAIMANATDALGDGYFVDEFYDTETTDEELLEAAVDMEDKWGEGVFYIDGRFPQTIKKFRTGHKKADGTIVRPVRVVAYTAKREDGLRELYSRFKGISGKPRQFVSKCCVNFISEALEYRDDVKERDHAIDAARYSLPLEQEEKPFLYVVRR